MAILITGALGHIGSNLSKKLEECGYKVVRSDLRILKEPNYERGDVTQFIEMHRIFKKYNVKHVYHLAGEVGRENGELFPRRCVDINVSGTLNLIQLCLEHDATLYYASTSEVYGDWGGKCKLTEDLVETQPVRPTNCYGISKLQAEQYIRHFVENYGLRALSFRFFMCYGEGEWPNHYRSAMANLIYKALTDQPMPVHKGTWRSWCYVDDIVEGCILAMEKYDPKRGYQAYNIGRDDLRPMEEIAALICDLAGKPRSLIEYTEPGRFVTPIKDASFAKAKEHLGYEARIPVEEGIERTIAWQRRTVLKRTELK